MKREDIKSERAGKARKNPLGFWSFIPKPLPPVLDLSTAAIQLLAQAQQQLGELAGIGRMLPNPYLLIQPSVHKEAVLSSRIEGTRSGLDDLYLFEAAPDESHPQGDVAEVHNYVTALEFGLERLTTLPMSLRLIREIHAKLMAGVREGQTNPGEFRRSQNWIGPPGSTLSEATFVPPPVEEMHEALNAFEKYLYEPSDLPDLIRIGLAHSQFEMIHPFTDGNGRVGRLLIALLLVYWKLLPYPLIYLSAFFERHRSDYYRHLLAVTHEGKWEGWLEFFLRGVREQGLDACRTGKSLLDLQSRYHGKLAGRRVSKITPAVLDQLFANPIVTAPYIRDRWSVNFRTAQSAIDTLVTLGILKETTGLRRNRTWLAEGILAAIEGRER